LQQAGEGTLAKAETHRSVGRDRATEANISGTPMVGKLSELNGRLPQKVGPPSRLLRRLQARITTLTKQGQRTLVRSMARGAETLHRWMHCGAIDNERCGMFHCAKDAKTSRVHLERDPSS
jgi:hypothetical protein